MQNLWQELPRTQALSSFEFTEYNKINLNDKTTLVNLYDDNINIASISIIVDFSVFDEKDRIGISNFAAEMLKLGTKTKNATQIAAEIEQ